MLKTYSETKLIRTSNCDSTGHWRPGSILAMMQELAGTHAHLIGCGREVMLKEHIVWVLSRTELCMDRYPVVGETVRVDTFPMPNKRWFFPRYFVFYDEAGEVIGKASTLWLLMDVEERKMAAPEKAIPYLPDNSDLTAPMPFPGNMPALTAQAVVSTYQPVYTDIDVNQHMNNTKYAEVLCNVLGMETMREYEIAKLILHYHKEVLLEQQLEISLLLQGEQFRLSGTAGDEKFFDVGGELRGRK